MILLVNNNEQTSSTAKRDGNKIAYLINKHLLSSHQSFQKEQKLKEWR